MLFWRTLQCQINIDAISGRYCIAIGNIIGSIYFSNIKPILQKTIFAECWVWISSQYWDCILAQYLVNNFAIGSIIFQGTPQYQVNIDPITTWYCLDIGIIIGSIFFSNIKPILQKTIFAECWVWISSQYWDCILAQYLVNKFCYLGRSYKRHEKNKRKTGQERSSLQQADYHRHRPTPWMQESVSMHKSPTPLMALKQSRMNQARSEEEVKERKRDRKDRGQEADGKKGSPTKQNTSEELKQGLPT